MFGNILSAITRLPLKENSYQSEILKQVEGLEGQLQELSHALTKLPLESILSAMQSNRQQKLVKFQAGRPSQQTISILEQFYRMCAHQDKQNKRCQLTLSEVQKIIQLSNQHDLITMLNLNDALPSQRNIQYFNHLLRGLVKELTHWQNQRNINLFEAEEGEEIQHWDYVIKFLERAKARAEQTYFEMIRRSYYFSENQCILRQKYLSCLWSERDKFWQEFMVKLMEWLQGYIVYDINNRQYTVKVYDAGSNEEGQLWLKQVSKIIFESSEIGLHEEAVRGSLSHLNTFLGRMEQLLPPQRQNDLTISKRKLVSRFKDYFQHMIPYLRMQKRRVFMEMLAVRGREASLYDLLLNLKAGRQDADILIATIQAVQLWIQQNHQDQDLVMLFLNLAKQSKCHWSTVMFLSDQLIQAVEEWEESEEKIRLIRQLLIVREETRIKIHGVE